MAAAPPEPEPKRTSPPAQSRQISPPGSQTGGMGSNMGKKRAGSKQGQNQTQARRQSRQPRRKQTDAQPRRGARQNMDVIEYAERRCYRLEDWAQDVCLRMKNLHQRIIDKELHFADRSNAFIGNKAFADYELAQKVYDRLRHNRESLEPLFRSLEESVTSLTEERRRKKSWLKTRAAKETATDRSGSVSKPANPPIANSKQPSDSQVSLEAIDARLSRVMTVLRERRERYTTVLDEENKRSVEARRSGLQIQEELRTMYKSADGKLWLRAVKGLQELADGTEDYIEQLEKQGKSKSTENTEIMQEVQAWAPKTYHFVMDQCYRAWRVDNWEYHRLAALVAARRSDLGWQAERVWLETNMSQLEYRKTDLDADYQFALELHKRQRGRRMQELRAQGRSNSLSPAGKPRVSFNAPQHSGWKSNPNDFDSSHEMGADDP